jgi:hypothetical protein
LAAAGTFAFDNGSVAGPWITSPSAVNIEPWHGQSQLFSALFQVTVQPRWVQAADRAISLPFGER